MLSGSGTAAVPPALPAAACAPQQGGRLDWERGRQVVRGRQGPTREMSFLPVRVVECLYRTYFQLI